MKTQFYHLNFSSLTCSKRELLHTKTGSVEFQCKTKIMTLGKRRMPQLKNGRLDYDLVIAIYLF